MALRISQATETDTRCVCCGKHIRPGTDCVPHLALGIPSIPLAICMDCAGQITSAVLNERTPFHVVPAPPSARRPTPFTWKCPTESCGAQVDTNWDECVWCGSKRPTPEKPEPELQGWEKDLLASATDQPVRDTTADENIAAGDPEQ